MSRYTIIGGTGTLGNALVRAMLKKEVDQKDIWIISRDELKQYEMKKIYPKIHYSLGDIRDFNCDISGTDVFHFAALKQIDVMESNVTECVKTNIEGTLEVLTQVADSSSVDNFVFSSTDKAVLPVNTYGACKMLSEKCIEWTSQYYKNTNFSIYRWGNVIGSRGSAVNLFIEKIAKDEPVPITDKRMTRFWIDIDAAAEWMFDTYDTDDEFKIMIPKHLMKAARVIAVVKACAVLMNRSFEPEYIGIRDGEKIHECLESRHEECYRSDNCEQYSMTELVELIRPVYEKSPYYRKWGKDCKTLPGHTRVPPGALGWL